MRILMIAPEPFLEPRGTPFSVYHRIKALVTLGYEVDLVTYPMGQRVSLPGLRVYRTPALPGLRCVKIGPSLAKFPLDALLFVTALWRLCRRRYQYVHTHEEAGAMGALLALVFGCKHLYDMHSDLAQQMENFALLKRQSIVSALLLYAIQMIQTWMVRRADAIIAICPDLEKTVRHLAPHKSVYMIENVAIDEALPPVQEGDIQQLREQWQLGDGPVLLYTGTFEHYQGIELLLQSVSAVKAVFPAVRYVLVGGRPEQVEQQRQMAQRLAIADIVCFTGQCPLEEMPRYMALADILLSPRSEGTNTPLKLYTYLRSGKPILATTIVSHTQILTNENALLVAPTAEDLAQGTMELLSDGQRARTIGEAGQRLAEKNYSWPVFLEKNQRAYAEFTSSVHTDK